MVVVVEESFFLKCDLNIKFTGRCFKTSFSLKFFIKKIVGTLCLAYGCISRTEELTSRGRAFVKLYYLKYYFFI